MDDVFIGCRESDRVAEEQVARIAALESQLREREAECITAKKRAHAAEQNLGMERHGFLARIDELIDRAVAAESALGAARAMLESWKDAADEDREALIDAGIEMTGHSIVYGIRKLAALRARADDAGLPLPARMPEMPPVKPPLVSDDTTRVERDRLWMLEQFVAWAAGATDSRDDEIVAMVNDRARAVLATANGRESKL